MSNETRKNLMRAIAGSTRHHPTPTRANCIGCGGPAAPSVYPLCDACRPDYLAGPDETEQDARDERVRQAQARSDGWPELSPSCNT